MPEPCEKLLAQANREIDRLRGKRPAKPRDPVFPKRNPVSIVVRNPKGR